MLGNAGERLMNVRSMWVLTAGLVAVAAAVPVSAHHSFAAEYDQNRPITVTGEVIKLEWTNPHARVAVDARDEKGTIVHWDFELGPPTALMRRGWNRNSLKPGTQVTVAGFLAKDQPNVANARTVTLADGRQVFAGSSFDTQAPATANGVSP
jgi:DNA/RNA endonuclease YhcR with UshA esterase domain